MERLITKVSDLEAIVDELDSENTELLFRGQRDEAWSLVPKIGRLKNQRKKVITTNQEKAILQLFKNQSAHLIPREPETECEWLCIGQHYGLPTRLLDWTRNPLAALFFAVEMPTEQTSAFFVFSDTKKDLLKQPKDPFTVTDIVRYIPRFNNNRIRAQVGLFTIHSQPTKPLESPRIHKFIIPNAHRSSIKKQLNLYGVHGGSLFPELAGLCQHITWLRTDEH